MRIQTRGNSTTVWLCSDIGVIDGTMTMSAPTLEKILQAVNEKYGTSFEGWSQLPTAYEVGDTVPNWDAYEKILILLKDGFYKFDTSSGQRMFYAAMIVQNGVVELYASSLESGNNICVYGSLGNFVRAGGNENIIPQIQEICRMYPNFVSVSKYVKDNSNLENWDDYSLLS